METQVEYSPFVRELMRGRQANGPVFWLKERELAVLDAEAAQRFNTANFGDLQMPTRLIDLLLRRHSPKISWLEVRTAWQPRLAELGEEEAAGSLAAEMAALLDATGDRPQDLVWLLQRTCTEALLKAIVAGLPAHRYQPLVRSQNFKLARLMRLPPRAETLAEHGASFWLQFRAGLVVRRELRARARSHRPRQRDLLDPLVDLLPTLGLDRAVDSLTTVLTAITGPPGAVAACMVFELVRRPEWQTRLAAELGPLPLGDVATKGPRCAPVTFRFVRETLRLWSSPVVLTRRVLVPIKIGNIALEPGQAYHVSPWFIHHDPALWPDAEVFDPDRWLPGSLRGPREHHAFAPFGWAPTACLGASLGIAQLMVLCHLFVTRYQVELADSLPSRVLISSVPLPLGFHGRVVYRRGDPLL